MGHNIIDIIEGKAAMLNKPNKPKDMHTLPYSLIYTSTLTFCWSTL